MLRSEALLRRVALSSLNQKRNLPDGSQGSPAGGQGLISLPVLKSQFVQEGLYPENDMQGRDQNRTREIRLFGFHTILESHDEIIPVSERFASIAEKITEVS